MTSTNLFRQLQREWAVLAASETARHAVARWAVTEPDLAGYADPARIVKRCARRTDPAAANRLLAAVLRVAADDALARRTVLQALLPGIAGMSRKANTIGWCRPSCAWADLRELDHELLTLACERISVAAGQDLQWPAVTLTAQVWRRLRIAENRHRRYRRQQLRTVPLERHPDIGPYLENQDFIDPGESWEEQLTRVVCEAVRDGTVAPGDGAAIFSTRILGLPSEQAADQLQVSVGALWQRRRRAERTLAKTLAAAA